MPSRQRILVFTTAGLLAGFLTWFACFHSSLLLALTTRPGGGFDQSVGASHIAVFIGLFFGILFGAADALSVRDLKMRMISAPVSIVVGVLAAVLACGACPIVPISPSISLAQPALDTVNAASTSSGPHLMPLLVAWGLLGMLLGIVPGLVSLRVSGALLGALGGALGGFIGGIPASLAFLSWQSSGGSHSSWLLIGYAITGAAVGFGSSTAPLALKRWQEDITQKVVDLIESAQSEPEIISQPQSKIDEEPPAASIFSLDDDVTERPAVGAAQTNTEGQEGGESQDRHEAPYAKQEKTFSSYSDTPPAKLVCTGGPYYGEHFYLHIEAETTIGRSPDQSISIPLDSAASRSHARIVFKDASFLLYDLESKNGLLLNGAVMGNKSRRLFPGDTIELGKSKFVFQRTKSS